MNFKKDYYYGVFSVGIYESLVTPDKQLHAGPGLILNEDDWWSYIGSFMVWLQGKLPNETFTLVIADDEDFDNDYWKFSVQASDKYGGLN